MTIKTREKWLLAGIFALGLFARLYRFGALPAGLNQDEAFAAYDAWALLRFGTDSALHPWPVYLTAWGSGMNALETYLMIPLLALFGVKTWVIRLPQLMIALASLPAAYSVGRRLAGERGGLISAAVLALCPWHILLSRWGLESNLAPGMLLFGLCFSLKGLEDGRFLPLSALFYGLSLYAYSAVWPVMPLLLGLMLLLARPRFDRHLVASGVLLAGLALPALGFLAVNYGLLEEFSLGPFTVPRLVAVRAGEVSFSRIPENLKTMLTILLTQSDGLKWNSPGIYGLFYPIALPFGLAGLFTLCRRSFHAIRARQFDPASLLLAWVLAGTVLCCLISVNVNRMNFLLMPLALTLALGADTLLSLCGRYKKIAAALGAAVLLGFFCFFQQYYFTDYTASLRGEFTAGAEEALDAALAHEGPVYLSRTIHYPKLLLFAEISPADFNADVEYVRYPAPYLSARRVGRCSFLDEAGMPLDPDAVYVLWAGTEGRWREAGFTLERHGCYQVACCKAAP